MRYMGGKFRQSKAIVEVLRPYINNDTVYEWGDTVVRHLNSKGTDGTNERLVKYAGV